MGARQTADLAELRDWVEGLRAAAHTARQQGNSPYREVTTPILDYIRDIHRDSPRDAICVFIPEYVVGHWWEHLLHNQSALRLKARLLFTPGVMVTSVPYHLTSSHNLITNGAASSIDGSDITSHEQLHSTRSNVTTIR